MTDDARSAPDAAADPGGPLEGDDGTAAGAGRRRQGSVAVGLVAAFAGVLFATNASVFDDASARSPQNLADLVRVETQRLEENEAAVQRLRERRDELVAAQQPQPTTRGPEEDLFALEAGRSAVTGPGVVVELWDAPTPTDLAASGLHPDDLIVHQQDLEAVVNALWAGGAEAMMIQDQRITSTSAVRCVGNVLLLHGRHYSPPYRVAAIGEPQALEAALLSAPGVQVYQQYVESVGLGWSLEHSERIDMPPYTGSLRLEHAQAPLNYARPDLRNDQGDP